MTVHKQNARNKAYDRQRGLCFYCRAPVPRDEATVDHRIPQSKGGKLGRNAVMACRPCNESKGSLTEAEFHATRDLGAIPRGWSPARHDLWKRADALAAGSRRAKTPTAAECEASQSGGDSRNAQNTSREGS